MCRIVVNALLAALFSCPSSWALPLYLHKSRRSDGTTVDTGSLSPGVWVPLLSVGVALVLCIVLYYFRGTWRPVITSVFGSGWSFVVGGFETTHPAPQMTQTSTTPAANMASRARTAVTNATARRTRPRPPSQISTKSLPTYMKEPGEQELVVFRHPVDIEDIRAATIEEEESVDPPSRPGSAHVLPILDTDLRDGSSQDDVNHHTILLEDADCYALTSPEGPSLPPGLNTNTSSPPEPAPAYYENTTPVASGHVQSGAEPEQDQQSRHSAHAEIQTPAMDQPPLLEEQRGRRRSALKNIFSGVFPNAGTPSRFTHGHTRVGSNASATTTDTAPLTRQRRRSPSRSTQTPSYESPSMVSIDSISPPLTHTLVHSEFTYPRSGLTADQIKLISRKSSFRKFGVPYGEDAVRWASRSRMDSLNDAEDADDMPPEFHEPNGSRSRPRSRSTSRSRGHERTESSTSQPPALPHVRSGTPFSVQLPIGSTSRDELVPAGSSSVPVTSVPSGSEVPSGTGARPPTPSPSAIQPSVDTASGPSVSTTEVSPPLPPAAPSAGSMSQGPVI